MKIVTDKRDGIIWITLADRVAREDVDALREHFDLLAKQDAPRVILDMKDLVYFSSGAIGVLIDQVQRFRDKGGDIHLIQVNPKFLKMLKSMSLTDFIKCFETKTEAIHAFDDAPTAGGRQAFTDPLPSFYANKKDSELQFPTLQIDINDMENPPDRKK